MSLRALPPVAAKLADSSKSIVAFGCKNLHTRLAIEFGEGLHRLHTVVVGSHGPDLAIATSSRHSVQEIASGPRIGTGGYTPFRTVPMLNQDHREWGIGDVASL